MGKIDKILLKECKNFTKQQFSANRFYFFVIAQKSQRLETFIKFLYWQLLEKLKFTNFFYSF